MIAASSLSTVCLATLLLLLATNGPPAMCQLTAQESVLVAALDRIRGLVFNQNARILSALYGGPNMFVPDDARNSSRTMRLLGESKHWHSSANWRRSLIDLLYQSAMPPPPPPPVHAQQSSATAAAAAKTVAATSGLPCILGNATAGSIASLLGPLNIARGRYYTDRNCDRQFTPGVDTVLPNTTIIAQELQFAEFSVATSDFELQLVAQLGFIAPANTNQTGSMTMYTVNLALGPSLVGPSVFPGLQGLLNANNLGHALYEERGSALAPVSIYEEDCRSEVPADVGNESPIDVQLAVLKGTGGGLCNTQLTPTLATDTDSLAAIGVVWFDADLNGIRSPDEPGLNLADRTNSLRLFVAGGTAATPVLIEISQEDDGTFARAISSAERKALGDTVSVVVAQVGGPPLISGIASNQTRLCGTAFPPATLAFGGFDTATNSSDSFFRTGTFFGSPPPLNTTILGGTYLVVNNVPSPSGPLRPTANFGVSCLNRGIPSAPTMTAQCDASQLTLPEQQFIDRFTFSLAFPLPIAIGINFLRLRFLIAVSNRTQADAAVNATGVYRAPPYQLTVSSQNPNISVVSVQQNLIGTSAANVTAELLVDLELLLGALFPYSVTIAVSATPTPGAGGCFAATGASVVSEVLLKYANVAMTLEDDAGFVMGEVAAARCVHQQAASCASTGFGPSPSPPTPSSLTSHTAGLVVLLAVALVILAAPLIIGTIVFMRPTAAPAARYY